MAEKKARELKHIVVEMFDGLVSDVSVFDTHHDAQDRMMCLEAREGTEGTAWFIIHEDNQVTRLHGFRGD